MSLQRHREGRYEQSIEAARSALDLRPDYGLAYNNICAAYCALGQWDEAMSACEAAARLLPDHQLARGNLAWARSGRGRAGSAAGSAFAAPSRTPDVLVAMSLRLYGERRFHESIRAARDALRLRPQDDAAYNNICAAHNALGDWSLAFATCRRALELNPANRVARNNLAWATARMAPSTPERDSFWYVAPLRPHTVNGIDSPMVGGVPLAGALLALIVVLTVVLAAAWRRHGLRGLLESFLAASAVAALLFAARMDYGWITWLARDVRQLGPLDPTARIAHLEGPELVGLARDVRGIIPPGRSLRVLAGDDPGSPSADRHSRRKRSGLEVASPTRARFAYHALPVTLSDRGEYLLVIRDPRVVHDPASRTIAHGGVRIAESVDLLRTYSPGVFLYRTGGVGR